MSRTEGTRVLVAVAAELEPGLVQALERSRHLEVAHRCVDLTELLALASTGLATACVITPELRHLDRVTVARLAGEGVAVVGLAVDEGAASALYALGVTAVVRPITDGSFDEEQLLDAVSQAQDGAGTTATMTNWAAHAVARTGVGESGEDLEFAEVHGVRADVPPAPTGTGTLVAVWGPAGSPGRTSVAVNLAAELASRKQPTLLADADSYAASIAQSLGILDEAPGLAAACRAASNGHLDLATLARLSPMVTDGLRVLTGISRSDRWPELAGPNLEQVWAQARRLVAWTIVDTGFCTEADEELSYDTFAPRRNTSTLVSLEQADLVIAVGSADPVGLQRLIRGLADLRERHAVSPLVVVTRARASAVGTDPQRRITESLERFAGVSDPIVMPDDRDSFDAAMLAGRCLVEHSPRSAVRQCFRDLADRVCA